MQILKLVKFLLSLAAGMLLLLSLENRFMV